VGRMDTADETKVLPEDSKTRESAHKLGETKRNTSEQLNKKQEDLDMCPTPEAEGFWGNGREENQKRLNSPLLMPEEADENSPQGRSPDSGQSTLEPSHPFSRT